MMRLKLVKMAEEENTHLNEDDEGIPHGGWVLRELVSPWTDQTKIVYVDSYFALVATAEMLRGMEMWFFVPVKTATKMFPMAALRVVEFVGKMRGQRKGMVHYDSNRNIDYLAFVWVDRDRQHFISMAGSLLDGKPYG